MLFARCVESCSLRWPVAPHDMLAVSTEDGHKCADVGSDHKCHHVFGQLALQQLGWPSAER
eukprot:4638528-Amphidinium_carterae.1